MKKILIAGATGYVGTRLIPKLVEEGHVIRCLARNPEKLTDRNWPGVEFVQGDVLDLTSLKSALKDIDIAYYLVHAMGNQGDFRSRDKQSARNFALAAKLNGIERIIYLGGLGDPEQNLSDHLQSRQEVGRILNSTGIAVTELRAAIIIGWGSASFEIIRDLVKKLPVMITPRWVKSRCQPIAIDDVLYYLIAVLKDSRTIGETFDIGGDEILTYEAMMRQVALIMGKKLKIINVPVLTPHLSSYWLNLVTSVPMSIAFPLVEGLRNDTICSDQRINEYIPLTKTSFKDAVRMALQTAKNNYLESRWTQADIIDNTVTDSLNGKFLYDEQILSSPATAKEIFHRIQKIGGTTGWYYANWAWKLRGIFDRLIGGIGMRRGRRHPTELRVGDTIDFWRVEKLKIDSYLKLRAEMKLPGIAWLEFKVNQEGSKTILVQRASFKPANWFGYAYWYLLLPVHLLIFKNMARKIAVLE
jgi:uncharacterized protein YbjT (DUF2867 family)